MLLTESNQLPFVMYGKLCLIIATLATSLLSGCGGGSGATGSSNEVVSVPAVEQNLFRVESLPPTIALFGIGETSFFTATAEIVVRGSVSSASKKAISLTATLNGADQGHLTIDRNGIFAAALVLTHADNTVTLTAEDSSGLRTRKQFSVSFVSNAEISRDLLLNTGYIVRGKPRQVIANIQFSKTQGIVAVELRRATTNAPVALMLDNGALPDEISGDGIYTGSFTVDVESDIAACYVASITTATKSYNSGTHCLKIIQPQTNETINKSVGILKLITRLVEADTSNATPEVKAKRVVDKVKSNSHYSSTFRVLQYTDQGAIFWTTVDGASGSYLPDFGREGTQSIGSATRLEAASSFYISPHDAEFNSPYTTIFAAVSASDAVDNRPPLLNKGSRNTFDNLFGSGVVHIKTHGGQMRFSEADGSGNDVISMLTMLSTNESVPNSLPCSEAVKAVYAWMSDGAVPPSCLDYSSLEDGVAAGLYNIHNGLGAIGITSRYLREKYRSQTKLASSLVFVDACTSAENSDLRDVFFQVGAAAYIGYINDVYVRYANTFAARFYEELMKGVSVQEAFGAALQSVGADDKSYGSVAQKVAAFPELFFSGVNDLALPDLSLKNGSFEDGSLIAWQASGDARVLTKLEEFVPEEGRYFGIISTGLGYTVDAGSIWQKVQIDSNASALSFSWNFLSEEFKEYCGSPFQDYFKVIACTKDDVCSTLLNRAIDDLCPAVEKSNARFDQGDVWTTGWRTERVSISAYRGRVVTLRFEAHDIGDSYFDSAILLDAIKIQ